MDKPTPKYTAIIFDLDGVICHTDQYHYQGWKAIADQLGAYFDETINHRLRGVSRMESLAIVLERYPGQLTPEEKIQWANRKNDIYVQLLHDLKPEHIDPDVPHTLQTLKEQGIKLAIGSSSKNAPFILEQTGLTHFFDAIADGTTIQHSKPHPEVFLQAADKLGEAYKNCLVVEDAESGVDAGLAAGMDVAAIGDAVHCGKSQHAIEKLSDLLPLL